MATDILDDEDELTDEEKKKKSVVAPPQPGEQGLPAVGSSVPDETHTGLEGESSSQPGIVAAPGQTMSSVAPPNITMAPAYPEGSSPSSATGQVLPTVSPDKQRLQDLESGQSGVSKMHGIGGGIVKGLDVAGSILAPRAMTYIPGSSLNYQHQLDVARQNVTQDNSQQQQEQQIADEQAQAQQRQALAEKAGAQTEAIQNPTIKPPNPAAIASAAKMGYKFDENGMLTPMSDDEVSPEIKNQRALAQATKDLRNAQTALANSKNDPNSAAYKLEQAKVAEATERTHQAMAGLGLRQQEFTNKVQEQNLVKPSGQASSRASAAQAALNVMPHLADLVHKNGASIGPLMGRISRGEIAIGDVPPDVAELYGAMKSFYALQPAVHGFRNAEFVKDFETAIGTLERDPEAFLAGMKGLEPTMKAVAEEGRTYHPRIVSGQNPPSGGQAEMIRARDRQGKLHEAPKGTPLPKGWKPE